MKKEKWMKWEPIRGIPQTLCLKNLKYDSNNLIINLFNPTEKSLILTIDFDGFLAFRTMDESKFFKYSYDLDKALTDKQLESNSLQPWSLFKVDNSHYLKWFLEQSCGIHENDKIIHYLIATPYDIVEILDIEGINHPIVKWN